MPALTVNVVVIQEKQVLLTKRDDFEVWCLPSGGVEEGESAAQAAVRETREESGLEIELLSLVGVYSRLGDLPNTHALVFTARPCGGNLRPQPGETIELRFFSADELPEPLSFGHRQRIEDALSGTAGLAVAQEMVLPAGHKVVSADILAARQLPRQARVEFYRRTLGRAALRTTREAG